MSDSIPHKNAWQVHTIPFEATRRFSKLVLDYLNGDKRLSRFVQHQASWDSFASLMRSRQDFPDAQRKSLGSVLRQQYADIELTAREDLNLAALESDAFTVTTGQQLVLAGGPMYVVYKALHCISLANALSERFPDKKVVPIFWMATEDHDFEEIRSFHLFGHRIQVEGDGSTAVGRMKVPENASWLNEVEQIIGIGDTQSNVLSVLRKAYAQGRNWTQATRILLHHLFGEHGLICLDADVQEWKAHASDLFRAELETGAAAKALQERSVELDKHYKVQAFPRDLNLFYLTDASRSRIMREGNDFRLDGQDQLIPRNELLDQLESHPERFSPNVLLRPLYQEILLPNLAYIGGGAEVAYWMQLGKAFNTFKLAMPVLLLRNSVQLINEVQASTRQKAGLQIVELFQELHELTRAHVEAHTDLDLELKTYVERTMTNFNEIHKLAQQTDKSMLGAVEAQRYKQLKGLENLKKKLLRAEKKRMKVEVERIERLLDEIFPGGGLQERKLNWIEAELMMGTGCIDRLLKFIRPLSDAFLLIEIEGDKA